MALLARVWQRSMGRVLDERDAPLRAFEVRPLPPAGARVVFPLGEAREVALDVASADELQAFAAACAREATTPQKRFYHGAFTLRVEGSGLPPARGKRMVSFVRDDQRIFHAWCEEAILHTVWSPVEWRQALRLLVEELASLRGSPPAASDEKGSGLSLRDRLP